MRIVLTGATGFIGSAFARALAQPGIELRALIREPSEGWRLRGLSLQRHAGDIRDPDSLAGLFSGADWILHAAGQLGDAGISQSVYNAVHVDGTRNVLRAFREQAPDATFLHVSSPGILGPIVDIRHGFPNEDAPFRPTNPYEWSKAKGEMIARAFAADGLDVRIIRPEFVYGPGDTHVLGLFRAIQRGFFFYIGSGCNTCHPTFIDDVVNGMVAILHRGRAGRVYHITGPRPVEWREFGATVAAALGVKPPWLHLPRQLLLPVVRTGEAVAPLLGRKPPLSVTGVNFFSENRGTTRERAQAELDYEPAFSLEQGALATVNWYRGAGLLPANGSHGRVTGIRR